MGFKRGEEFAPSFPRVTSGTAVCGTGCRVCKALGRGTLPPSGHKRILQLHIQLPTMCIITRPASGNILHLISLQSYPLSFSHFDVVLLLFLISSKVSIFSQLDSIFLQDGNTKRSFCTKMSIDCCTHHLHLGENVIFFNL